jgi:hypothetical protein
MNGRNLIHPWRGHLVYGPPPQMAFGFGHDFRPKTIRIVQSYSGAPVCDLFGTDKNALINGALVRQAPIMAGALYEASDRLARAKHQNAVALRQVILNALRGLDEPLVDELPIE